MKAAIFPAVLAGACPGVIACSDDIDRVVCDDRPPAFRDPVVAAEIPRASGLPQAVLGEDGSLLAWSETTGDPAHALLRTRCLGADGAARGDGEIPVDGQISMLTAARAADGYHLIYGVWAAGHSGDPVTQLAIDVDCDGAITPPRTILEPAPSASVMALLPIRGGYAFLLSTPDALSLGIETAAGITTRVIASPPVWGTLAASDDAIAFVALIPTGVELTTFELDGRRRLGPTPVRGTAEVYDGRACWDGAGWSLAVNVRKAGAAEILYTRVDPSGGAPPWPAQLSDGSGQSYDPAIACGDGAAAIAFRRNAGGQVPGSDLVTSTIELVELATPDGTVRHGPIELEPPAARLSMFPTLSTGAHLLTTWTAFDADGYEQRFAATPDRCIDD